MYEFNGYEPSSGLSDAEFLEVSLPEGCNLSLYNPSSRTMHITLKNRDGDYIDLCPYTMLEDGSNEAKNWNRINDTYLEQLYNEVYTLSPTEIPNEIVELFMSLFKSQKDLPDWFRKLDEKIKEISAFEQAEEAISDKGPNATLASLKQMVGEIPTDQGK